MKNLISLTSFVILVFLFQSFISGCEKVTSEPEINKYEDYTEYTILKGNHISENYAFLNTNPDLNFSFVFGEGTIYAPIEKEYNLLTGFTAYNTGHNMAIILWKSNGDSIDYVAYTSTNGIGTFVPSSRKLRTCKDVINHGRIWQDGANYNISINDRLMVSSPTAIYPRFNLNTPIFGYFKNTKSDTLNTLPAPQNLKIYIKFEESFWQIK